MALKGRIPDNKFAGQSTITSVVFGKNCNFIGQNAFGDCISLSKINDDNKIENIQPYAFANCSNLLSVNFNELSINLCSNAFYGCNNLESVNMPQCINIPTNAFANCYNLMYINIPNVTEIGVSAFSSCYNLMSVNIEKNFYQIYPYAFYGCSNLKDINLNKCLSIGERAFDCCSSLNTINLSMCNFIGSYAFNECINISQVTLSSCDSIYEGAFTNCYNLNKVYINNPESRFCSLYSSHVFCIHDKSTPSLCSINSGITFYFRADVIDKYKKDRYWNYYKDYMMSLLQNNQILYTTDDKEPINIDEYNNKPTTTNTAVNKNLTNYIIMEFKNKVDNLNYGIFKDSSTLTSIDLPLGCQSIGANEFENCIKLEEFKPSDTLKNIGNYAFKNCKSLSSFTIPESVDTLGEGIFAGCENIDTFKGKENFIKYNGKSLVYNNTLICVLPKDNSDTEGRFYKILDIDADIVRLGESCFYGCKNMRRVDIPSSVEEIGSGAFEKCTNLYEIHFEGDEPPTIGNGVFNNIHKDFKIFVPESSLSKYNEKWQELKKHIYPKAENDCIIYYGDKLDLTDNTNEIYDHESKIDESSINGTYHKLSFKQSIIDIPNYFTNTSSIEKIIIGDNITRIGESAFKNCTNLKYIYLSDMISEFGTECFYNCEKLTRIHIPRKLFDDKDLNIGDDIFYGCSKLKEFGSYVKGVVSDDNRCFMIANSLKFFAQGDMEASYTIPDNIVDINRSAFRDSKITSIKLSQSTKTIGEHAFDGCTNLKSIENWNGVESIKEYAFMNCNISYITLPEKLSSLGNECFYTYAETLTVYIPSSLKTPPVFKLNGNVNIDSNPFGDPNNVTGLTIYSTDFNLTNKYKSDVFWEKYKEFIELKFVGIQMLNIILDDAYLDSEFLYTKYKISDIGNVRWGDNICLYNSIWEKFDSDYKIIQSDTPTKMKFFLDNYTANKFLNNGVQNYSTLNISIPMECIDDNSVKFRIIVSIPNFGRLLQNGLIDIIYEYRPTTVMLSMNTHTDSGKDDDNITTLNSDKQDFGETITYLMPWTENYNENDIYKMSVPSKISRKIYPSIMYIPSSGASEIHNISIKLNNEWTSIGDGNEIYNGDHFSILSWAKYSSEPFKDILNSMGMSSNEGVNINIDLIR